MVYLGCVMNINEDFYLHLILLHLIDRELKSTETGRQAGRQKGRQKADREKGRRRQAGRDTDNCRQVESQGEGRLAFRVV